MEGRGRVDDFPSGETIQVSYLDPDPLPWAGFAADGSVASGPPLRPLDRFPVRVRNGVVEIQALGVPEPERGET